MDLLKEPPKKKTYSFWILLDSPSSGCPMDKKSSLANPNRGCKAGPKNGS
jgi:hypothetical protein